jgi:hypothetical protein
MDRFVRAHNNRRGRSQQQQQQEEEAGRGPPTSGAEEVDRILTEARRRYGRIRPTAFRENIDAQNISVIIPPKGQPQQPDISEVDKAAAKIAKTIFHAPSGKRQSSSRSRVGVKKVITTSSSSSLLTSSTKEESTTSSLSRDRTPSSSRSVVAEEGEGEEVNVRIPLEEASINLRIRTRGDPEDRRHPLAGRRIHVRVRNFVPLTSSSVVRVNP